MLTKLSAATHMKNDVHLRDKLLWGYQNFTHCRFHKYACIYTRVYGVSY